MLIRYPFANEDTTNRRKARKAVAEALPLEGHDGPFQGPVVTGPWTVQPEWIDYNGHMNVAYYTLAMDWAVDALLENALGLGPTFVKRAGMGPFALASTMHYFAELGEGDTFRVEGLLLDHDTKRMHLALSLYDARGTRATVLETLLMNVDHKTRKSTPYPDWAHARLARMQSDHDGLPRPDCLGATIGIRRR